MGYASGVSTSWHASAPIFSRSRNLDILIQIRDYDPKVNPHESTNLSPKAEVDDQNLPGSSLLFPLFFISRFSQSPLIMLVRLLSLVALLPLALADVEFSSPSAGESIPAGSNIFIKWTDHHGGTPISELSGYTIFLIAGGDSDSTSVSFPCSRVHHPVLTHQSQQQLPSTCVGDHTKGTTSASIPVNAAEGPEGSNA